MMKELSKKDFEEKFPDVSTYGLEHYSPVFLENGIILIETEWNGEVYIVNDGEKERIFRPISKPTVFDDDGEILESETIGYVEE